MCLWPVIRLCIGLLQKKFYTICTCLDLVFPVKFAIYGVQFVLISEHLALWYMQCAVCNVKCRMFSIKCGVCSGCSVGIGVLSVSCVVNSK